MGQSLPKSPWQEWPEISQGKGIYNNKLVNAVNSAGYPTAVLYKASLAVHGLRFGLVVVVVVMFKTEPHCETLTGLEFDI